MAVVDTLLVFLNYTNLEINSSEIVVIKRMHDHTVSEVGDLITIAGDAIGGTVDDSVTFHVTDSYGRRVGIHEIKIHSQLRFRRLDKKSIWFKISEFGHCCRSTQNQLQEKNHSG